MDDSNKVVIIEHKMFFFFRVKLLSKKKYWRGDGRDQVLKV